MAQMQLSPKLLSADFRSGDDRAFSAVTTAHGLYNTQQFVLRLSPMVHRTLTAMPSGIMTNRDAGFDGAQAMFDKHGALFVDKEDDDAIFPRLQPGRDEAIVAKAFNTFYQHAVVYDLTNQWISQPGPFRYDIDWLMPSASPERMKEFLRGNFKAAFQFDPETVEVIS